LFETRLFSVLNNNYSSASSAQSTNDTADHRFHDDLREHLVIIQKKVHVRLPGSSL